MHAHGPSGQWRRRHKGRDYYFGLIADPRAALARWRAEWPMIESGKPVVVTLASPSVALESACEAFLAAKLAAIERGELSPETYATYRQFSRRLCKAVGFDTPINLIGPADFDRLMEDMKGSAPATRESRVVKTRTILGWISSRYKVAFDIPDDFRGPTLRQKREQAFAARGQVFTPKDIHALLALSSPILRACILLGINGGYKPSDLSATKTTEYDAKARVIHQARKKTGAERRVPVWKETADAIAPIIDKDRKLLLAWPGGLALQRDGAHDLSRAMKYLRKAAGVTGEFKWLRNTFSTVASRTGDDHARDIIMGHTRDGVPDSYVKEFPAKRLKAVTDYVHRWLFNGA